MHPRSGHETEVGTSDPRKNSRRSAASISECPFSHKNTANTTDPQIRHWGGSQSCRNFLWESPLSFDGSSSSRLFKPGTLHSDDTRRSEDSTNWGARSHVRIGLDRRCHLLEVPRKRRRSGGVADDTRTEPVACTLSGPVRARDRWDEQDGHLGST